MTKTRILIVDDNWPIAKLIGSRLEATGYYEVRVENMPAGAFRAAAEFQPRLFLLDVEMPGMSGIELAAKLAKEPGFTDTPVIFLTSLVSSEEAGARELVSRGKRYLSKTASVAVTHACITRALSAPDPDAEADEK
ncbi:MAG: response regulator [Chthoniobacteraceae bacterium]